MVKSKFKVEISKQKYLWGLNHKMLAKLLIVVVVMFGFGYGLVPMYKAICEMTGINILALGERNLSDASVVTSEKKNTQIDTSRNIVVVFDTNTRGPWHFKPEKRSVSVHPGELTTVMYEFKNVQNHAITAQAIPSYAPQAAAAHFNKLECFCFKQYTLQAGEKKLWPVVFVIDPKLEKSVQNITLSYTFFAVGGKTPSAPA